MAGENEAGPSASSLVEQPPQEPILQYFTFQHLPAHLQAVSALFYNIAHEIVERTPRNPERSVALRKLLEAKDAAVRAALTK